MDAHFALFGDGRAMGSAVATARPGRRLASPSLRWAPPLPVRLEDWTVDDHHIVESTQVLARGRPAWSAVVAQEQRRGRGQRERPFVSDRGGLYLSAVLPYAGDPLRARGFALAVGWAVRVALLELGFSELRLRWPNDLMIGARKAGGILVEQGARDTLVVGIGLNVSNHPWEASPELRDVACSLQDGATRGLPSRLVLTSALLRALRRAFLEFEMAGFSGMVARLNASWGEPREVVLELAVSGTVVRGRFAGISPDGDVEIIGAGGTLCSVPEHHIARLREV